MITEKEQMFLRGGGSKMIAQSSGPTKVLAVFEQGKPPVPCKYKITDGRGNEHTISIDKVTRIDQRASTFVAYQCESYYEDIAKRYELRFWRDSYKWELILK